MRRDIVSVQLRQALTQPGCPICRLRSDSELRYIRALLWESVNDPTTRRQIVASLGYCPEHTWQVGLVEKEQFGSPDGNVIIYEHLADLIRTRLTAYARRLSQSQRARWRCWLHILRRSPPPLPPPDELQPQTRCRLCQVAEQSEQVHLVGLLQNLSAPEDDFRELYAASDGLCLPHLRQGLAAAHRDTETGVRFLIENALQRLAALQHDLSESDRKRAWDQQREGKTDAEKNAWLRVLRFFGGNRKVMRKP